ncbi:MAG: dTDP-4-dehydrorhamnose reductase [Pirellulales bacterium]
MAILVTGAKGQLGHELVVRWGDHAIPVTRETFDLSRPAEIGSQVERLQPTAVVHCAAYTAVDRAEEQADLCRTVNVDAVAELTRVCQRLEIPLVLVSTDYVFGLDATRSTPYGEDDATGPVNEYGRSKLAAEKIVVEWSRHLIVRTCGLYGHSPGAVNFVKTMLRLASERPRLRVVDDQHCTPSAASDVAWGIDQLLKLDARGIFHVVNEGATTWCEFAREVLRQSGLATPIDSIRSEEYPTKAARPRYSVLSTTKFNATVGRALPTWREALANFLALKGLALERKSERFGSGRPEGA